jgi:hypothetical protein
VTEGEKPDALLGQEVLDRDYGTIKKDSGKKVGHSTAGARHRFVRATLAHISRHATSMKEARPTPGLLHFLHSDG